MGTTKPQYDTDMTWEQYHQLAELTGEVDFKCDFDEKGQCRGLRERSPGMWRSAPQCCCQDCPMTVGYHNNISEDQAKVMKKRWSKKTGFWRKGKGCTLPRMYRSPICLTYDCRYDSGGRAKQYKALREVMSFLESGVEYALRKKTRSFAVIFKSLKAQLKKAKLIAPKKKVLKLKQL